MKILNYSKSRNTMIKGVVKNRAQHSQIENKIASQNDHFITKHLKPEPELPCTNKGA